MQFKVLGPFEICADDVPIVLARPRQRAVLAYLLLSANRPVSTHQLIDALWGDDAPATARAQIQADVSAIRRVLRDRITSERGGYRVRTEPGELDVEEFVAATRSTGSAADPPAVAVLLRRALALWRGTALADVTAAYAEAARAGLEEQRMAAYEELAEVELSLGREAGLVVELSPLLRAHPARERLCGQLMTALYRTGRQADALQVARQLRRHLADEHGIDPGPSLQQLEQAMLRADPALNGPPAGAAAPAQLPAAGGDFTGRADQLAQLDALLGARPAALVISAVAGAGGVGKTALAVAWASRVAHRFPDGQLFVNLQGFGPAEPARPLDALGGFLRALGVPGDQIPAGEDEAAALYRSRLAGRRILIVLDNAGTAEQVRPLLPGDPGCMVLVTSRHRLGALVATHGARRLTLDVLSEAEALDLLSRIAGAGRLTAEPAAAAELARSCSYLPLALRIAGAQLQDRPAMSIAAYVTRLHAVGALNTLVIDDDPLASVRATLDASYAHLSGREQHTLRRLGLLPGPDIAAAGAAALADESLPQTAVVLDRLVAAHLLERTATGRFAMHDLVREYAAGLCAPAEREAALNRLFAWYLGGVRLAVDLLRPDTLRLTRGLLGTDPPDLPCFGDRDEALRWLDSEQPSLVAAISAAADRGPLAAGWLLADAARGYFYLRPRVLDWLTVASAGLAAARAGGDLLGEAAAGLSLGDAEHNRGHYPEAIEHYRHALARTRAAAWSEGEATVLNNLGTVFQRTGRLADAADHYGRALVLRRHQQVPAGQAAPLLNLGSVEYELGRLTEAAEHYAQAVALFEAIDSRQGLSVALGNLGELCHGLGRRTEAREHLDRALAVTRELADRLVEGETLRMIACVDRDTGRLDRAFEVACTARQIFQDAGDQRYEPWMLNTLGTIYCRLNRPADALEQHRHALRRARESEAPMPEAEALMGLADAHRELRETNRAHAYVDEALTQIRRYGLRLLEGAALTSRAAIYLEEGEVRRAADDAGAAVRLHRATGHRLGEAAARTVLARSA